MLLILNAELYHDGQFEPGGVLCKEGKFLRIALGGPEAQDVLRAEAHAQTEECVELDAGGRRLVPGFIDLHTHGGDGVDVNAATEEDLKHIAAFFASQGTTAWHASVLTDTPEQTIRAIHAIQAVHRQRGYGAELMGIHLEGPFLSPKYKGAMPEHLLQKGNVALFRRYQDEAEGLVRYLTVAPEVEGVPELIEALSDEVVIAIGHSDADYETAWKAIRGGARISTHTFNAMRLFHQHEPAIMGAVLASDLFCEAICDGRHLAPATVRLLLHWKGWDKVVAITDSMMAAGLPDGAYRLGVNEVEVVDGDARLKSDGTRAGSTLTTQQALKNLVRFTGEPVEHVLPLLTQNPALAMHLEDRKGFLEEGLDADCVLLDADLTVHTTIVGGTIVYQAK